MVIAQVVQTIDDGFIYKYAPVGRFDIIVVAYFTLLYVTWLYLTLRYVTLRYFTLLYFTLLYFTLLYFTLLYFTLLYFTRTILPSASSRYTIGRLLLIVLVNVYNYICCQLW